MPDPLFIPSFFRAGFVEADCLNLQLVVGIHSRAVRLAEQRRVGRHTAGTRARFEFTHFDRRVVLAAEYTQKEFWVLTEEGDPEWVLDREAQCRISDYLRVVKVLRSYYRADEDYCRVRDRYSKRMYEIEQETKIAQHEYNVACSREQDSRGFQVWNLERLTSSQKRDGALLTRRRSELEKIRPAGELAIRFLEENPDPRAWDDIPRECRRMRR